MNKLVKIAGAAGIASVVAFGMVAPAAAAPWRYYHRGYYQPYYPAYDYYPGYYDYYPGYYGYYPYYDPGAAIASGIIGGIFGTILNEARGHRCLHVYHRSGKTYCRF